MSMGYQKNDHGYQNKTDYTEKSTIETVESASPRSCSQPIRVLKPSFVKLQRHRFTPHLETSELDA